MIKKSSEIYPYICHFIFAIIIAMSYSSTLDIFFNPVEPFGRDLSSFIRGVEILLVYIFMVSGWVGYSRSMLKWPHTDSKLGALRFSLDLGVLFCYFILLTFTQSEYSFDEHFLDFIIIVFVLFLFWDILKLNEYWKILDPKLKKKQKTHRYALIVSFAKTVCYTIIFVIVRQIYNALNEYDGALFIDSDTLYFLTLIISIVFILHYRYWKWRISSKPHGLMSPDTTKKSK